MRPEEEGGMNTACGCSDGMRISPQSGHSCG